MNGLKRTRVITTIRRCDNSMMMSSITAGGVEFPKPAVKPISLKKKVALVTGATAGIGLAITCRLAEQGCHLVIVGRRENRLQEIKNKLNSDYPAVDVYTVALDISNTQLVGQLPSNLPSNFRDVDLLINNAGLALGVTSVEENSIADASTVMNTNIMGTVAFCSAFIPGMVKRGTGHIVNIGSCAGHLAYVKGSIYNASKYAIHGFTSAARFDLMESPVRVTHISPGLVGNTEFSNVRLGSDEAASAVYDNIVPLDPVDVADNVLYALTRPLHVQIADILMYATNQAGPRDVARVGEDLGLAACLEKAKAAADGGR